MKIRKLLKLQSLLEERVIPCDMKEMEEVKYFSKSKNEFICILDMDLIHFIRVFRNISDEKKDISLKELSQILHQLKIREVH
tara:strand:+ start:306 stop:551 length:246 start_codon:yes stop_codon:yes gene_type:complete